MLFEDAVHEVHNLSNELANLVELKGELAEEPEGTSHYRQLKEKIIELSRNIEYMLYQLDTDHGNGSGLDKIRDNLVLEE